MIDNVIGSKFARFGHLALIAGGCDDLAIEEFRNLDSRDAYARICAQYKHCLTRTNARTPHQHVPGSKKDQSNAGGLVEVERIWDGDDIHHRSGNEFAIASIDKIPEHGAFAT